MTKLIIIILILLLFSFLTLKAFTVKWKHNLIITFVIGIIIISAIIFGLSTDSIKGKIIKSDHNDQLLMECQVPYLFTQGEEVGYYCSVGVTPQTVIKNLKGERLSVKEIEDKLVSVILEKRHIFTKGDRSREVTAKEITLLR
ncbi:hypothetical protein SAMN04487944_1352 [Gracilibacillus ureilyticus]|uniref:Uncharacterized protein n=1 Tax=Gracilibacillus ureilyticus TaxID=531814 RepID=A0A1H9W3H6_9BACI|nr:hypothetical protein [Gracilibacillus ureilyticus]SES28486.1 hypothetical protein SAMN04487944_1352 [Gracilibacillus ureilyticus]